MYCIETKGQKECIKGFRTAIATLLGDFFFYHRKMKFFSTVLTSIRRNESAIIVSAR